MDFRSVHPSRAPALSFWGSRTNLSSNLNRFCTYIYIEEGDLLVVNHRGSPPTFVGDRGQISWIDVTATSPILVARIADWRVDTSKEVASDHRLLLTQVRVQTQRAVV